LLFERLVPADNNLFGYWTIFFTPFIGQHPLTEDLTAPTVDIYDEDDKIVIEAEMPEFDKNNIHVVVNGWLLILTGEQHQEETVKEEKRYRQERSYGKFERSFNLPYEINLDTIMANYKKGVLTLEIPKLQEQKTRQITIN